MSNAPDRDAPDGSVDRISREEHQDAMQRYGLRLGLLAVVAALAGLLLELNGRPPPGRAAPLGLAGAAGAAGPAADRTAGSGTVAQQRSLAGPAHLLGRSALPPLPGSLQGTEVDGNLTVDANGDLVVDAELRRLFDYFLSATGEEPDDVIRARIEAALAALLPARAARQARALLEGYLAYRTRGRVLPESTGDLGARLATVRALRREVLGAEVAAGLFAGEEQLDEAGLARRAARAARDPAAGGTAASPSGLDPDLAAGGPVTAPLVTIERETALRAAGAPPAEIRQLREATFGAGGADRLEALDRARAAWQARLEAFRAARARLETAGAAAEEVEQLLERSFALEDGEQLRVRALERIAGRALP